MEKYFWTDPYCKELKSKIIKRYPNNGVVLDKTIGFIFKGGQESDDITINNIKVINSEIKDDEYIYYLEKPIKEDSVIQRINWDKRYKLMKLHSASHFVYFFFVKKTGIKDLIGSNIDSKKARIDFKIDLNINEILKEIEDEINNYLLNNYEIKTYFIDEKTREWKCNDFVMKCGGTHVKNTKEIGQIKLKRKNIGKGKERIEIYLME